MIEKRKKLPIGIQTFSEIIENGYYYVDKTEHALRLIDNGKYYFLSRPRRFGKSLFLDTLKEIFEGKEVLFKGLYIHDKWDWLKKYPVIKISFGGSVVKNRTELENRLSTIFRDNQTYFGIECPNTSDYNDCFAQLIEKCHEKYGLRTVILVDEYDKPILDNITEHENAREIRDTLRNLYTVIKDKDAHVKFAFITGVSKFSKVSLFSGLNNLNDITLDADYATICGYTESDLDTVFFPDLAGLDRDEIRKWYNGYNWLGEGVYNPFDVLLLFQKREYRAYWFETGTPTFLIDMLIERKVFAPILGQMQTEIELLSRFDVDDIGIEALLFQTGYLTIGETKNIPGRKQFILRYPNLEVQTSLNAYFGGRLVNDRSLQNNLSVKLYDILSENDFTKLRDLFHSFYSTIPADWYRNNTIANYEGFYASVFYTYFAGIGFNITAEDVTNKGKIDMSVIFNENIYIFEFKIVEDEPTGKAIDQIIAKKYADKYKSRGLPIHQIGVEFSRRDRNIVAFDVVSI